MKKLFLALLAVSFIFTAAACGNDTPEDMMESGKDLISDAGSDIMNGDNSGNSSATSNTNTDISKDKAIEIALEHAGLKKEQVRDLDAELETDNGVLKWDVDFEEGENDYSYDIDPKSGTILKSDKEHDPDDNR